MSIEIELCWPTVRQAGFVELVEVAAAAGFDALTVSSELCRRSGLDHRTLRRHLDEAGVRVTAVDGLPGALPGLAQSTAWTESEVLDLASALGAGGVNVSHFGGDPSVPRSVLAETLAQVAARAAQLRAHRHPRVHPRYGGPRPRRRGGHRHPLRRRRGGHPPRHLAPAPIRRTPGHADGRGGARGGRAAAGRSSAGTGRRALRAHDGPAASG